MYTLIRFFAYLCAVFVLTLTSHTVLAQNDAPQSEARQSENQVMQAFTSQEVKDSDIIAIDDKQKRVVMFFLGVPLLILLFVTGGLGIAMGIFGKQVFVAHMICAGLSMTLALGHAIVGIVWFYPF